MFQYSKDTSAPRVLLVSAYGQGESHAESEIHLEELAELARTLGYEIAEKTIFSFKSVNPKLYLGPGQLAKIKELAEDLDGVVLDFNLSPNHLRNWTKEMKKPVLDRHQIILDIFSEHASSAEARVQIELAQLEYELPRLQKAWTHLGRQRGGARGTRGEGETQLEADQRLIQRRINKLKKDLKEYDKRRAVRRKQRRKLPVPTIALVGYTNVGKSSLLRHLTGANIIVADQLFATLDPRSRKLQLPQGSNVVFSDTVGFIRKLPHDLIEAFRSTLEETIHSDLLIIMLDASSSDLKNQYNTSIEVLDSLHLTERERVIVFNKMDHYCNLTDNSADMLWIRHKEKCVVPISVKASLGIDTLLQTIEERILHQQEEFVLSIPYEEGKILSEIKTKAVILEEKYTESSIDLRIRFSSNNKHQFSKIINKFKKVEYNEANLW